jgi:hypothetical protein
MPPGLDASRADRTNQHPSSGDVHDAYIAPSSSKGFQYAFAMWQDPVKMKMGWWWKWLVFASTGVLGHFILGFLVNWHVFRQNG